MSEIAAPILEWLNANPELAGLATFLISAGESIAIIGTIVPGTVMMTAVGALVGAGVIPFWPTLIWAILGAIVGDGVSYWLGYYFKDRVRNVWPFKTHPTLLASGVNFFHRYGGMSVFIGRFVGPVRALVPLVAGMLGVKPWRFTLANITSAILWAPIYMLPGFILGAASTELPSEIATRAILLLIFIVLFIILCIWLTKKILDLIHQEVNQFLNWIWNSLKKSRYFSLLTTLLKHYDPKKTHGQLALAFYLVIACIAFLYLANFILYKGPEGTLNNIIFHLFRSLRSPSTDTIMIFITQLGEKTVLIPLIGTLTCFFIYTKNWRTAAHVLVLGLLTVGSIELFKYLVHSPRPWGVLGNNHSSFSFPSGHVGLAFTFYLGLTFLCIKIFEIKKRKLLYFSVSFLIFAIAISRLYFGVHWFTDVLGACFLSTALLIFITLSYNRKAEKTIPTRGVLATIFLTLLVSYSISTYLTFNKLKYNYTMLEWTYYTIKLDSWWQQKGNSFPLYRINRIGLPVVVFNIEWLGKLDEIKETLLKNGWESPPPQNWLSALYRITSVQSTEHLPLVSPIYLGKPPTLILVKTLPNSNKLIILRFWASQFLINNVQEPLWLGTVEYAPSTYSWLFKSKRPPTLSATSDLIFSSPQKKYDVKEMTMVLNTNNHTKNRNLLLIKPKSILNSKNDLPSPQFEMSQTHILIPINLPDREEFDLLG